MAANSGGGATGALNLTSVVSAAGMFQQQGRRTSPLRLTRLSRAKLDNITDTLQPSVGKSLVISRLLSSPSRPLQGRQLPKSLEHRLLVTLTMPLIQPSWRRNK